MSEIELPLYPKVSSIYNKIMQLAIAIFIIVVVMNIWLYSFEQSKNSVVQHSRFISKQYLSQVTTTTSILLKKERTELQGYLDEIAGQVWVKDISVYDETGQLIFATDQQSSLNDLYGISLFKVDKSEQFTPYIQELRTDSKLDGYVRVTIENKQLTDDLNKVGEHHHNLLRLMMILSGVVGFLLTRGLNRFSRQGFRLAHKN